MSEPDDPRWLSELSEELRREVPIRPAWRARLLDDVARSPRPSTDDAIDIRFDDPFTTAVIRPETGTPSRRSIVLSPLAGLAAAVALIALGAGVTYTVVGWRENAETTLAAAAGRRPDASTRLAADAPVNADREVVQFALSAPRASRVMLVGSFNEWNPAATPLARDPSTGMWTVSLRLPPGRHVYAFVVDGDVTADPGAPRAADDDFGSTNSVVFVSSPRS
jgi:hypothetical protein